MGISYSAHAFYGVVANQGKVDAHGSEVRLVQAHASVHPEDEPGVRGPMSDRISRMSAMVLGTIEGAKRRLMKRRGKCPECSWEGEWDPLHWKCGGCGRTQYGSDVLSRTTLATEYYSGGIAVMTRPSAKEVTH